MGNSQIPSNFPQTSHPILQQCRINKSNSTLELMFKPGPAISNWKWNLAPFQTHTRSLFLPLRLHDPQEGLGGNGFCMGGFGGGRDGVTVEYEPYVYTLENQIRVRKGNHDYFKEYQLWKLLKACTLALKDWYQVYPDISIGTLTPQSIVFNSTGHIKIINPLSSPQPPTILSEPPNPQYLPNSNPKPKQPETPLSQSIYNIGSVLLDATSLHQPKYSNVGKQTKMQLLNKSIVYTMGFKNVVLGMLAEDGGKRIGLGGVLEQLGRYRRSSGGNYV